MRDKRFSIPVILGELLISFWFIGGFWFLNANHHQTLDQNLPSTQIPVTYRSMQCTLNVPQANLSLHWPERASVSMPTAVEMFVLPQGTLTWECPENAMVAVFEESLAISLTARLEIPGIKVTPTERLTQEFRNQPNLSVSWQLVPNQTGAAIPATLWLDIAIEEFSAAKDTPVSGSRVPVESWLWLSKSLPLRVASFLGMPSELLKQCMFSALILGLGLILVAFAVRSLQKKRGNGQNAV